jgi:hypothetical protein
VAGDKISLEGVEGQRGLRRWRTHLPLQTPYGHCLLPVHRRPPPGLRNHKETWAGCKVSLTTSTRSALSASRSVSLRSWAEKVSSVFLVSYLLR